VAPPGDHLVPDSVVAVTLPSDHEGELADDDPAPRIAFAPIACGQVLWINLRHDVFLFRLTPGFTLAFDANRQPQASGTPIGWPAFPRELCCPCFSQTLPPKSFLPLASFQQATLNRLRRCRY
jgi:hypothetical protein